MERSTNFVVVLASIYFRGNVIEWQYLEILCVSCMKSGRGTVKRPIYNFVEEAEMVSLQGSASSTEVTLVILV